METRVYHPVAHSPSHQFLEPRSEGCTFSEGQSLWVMEFSQILTFLSVDIVHVHVCVWFGLVVLASQERSRTPLQASFCPYPGHEAGQYGPSNGRLCTQTTGYEPQPHCLLT